jgi:hypothetical protein
MNDGKGNAGADLEENHTYRKGGSSIFKYWHQPH